MTESGLYPDQMHVTESGRSPDHKYLRDPGLRFCGRILDPVRPEVVEEIVQLVHLPRVELVEDNGIFADGGHGLKTTTQYTGSDGYTQF